MRHSSVAMGGSHILLMVVISLSLSVLGCGRFKEEYDKTSEAPKRTDYSKEVQGRFFSPVFGLGELQLQKLLILHNGQMALLNLCTEHCQQGRSKIDVEALGDYRVLGDELRFDVKYSCRQLRQEPLKAHYYFRLLPAEGGGILQEISRQRLTSEDLQVQAFKDIESFNKALGSEQPESYAGCFEAFGSLRQDELKKAESSWFKIASDFLTSATKS